MDYDAARALALKTWEYKQGELVSLMIHIGRRLDLYTVVDRIGPAAANDVAQAAGLDERWVAEWLDGQAAAALLDRSSDARFSMTPEQRVVLIDETSLLHAGAVFNGGNPPALTEQIVEAFRTGTGFTYEAQGSLLAKELDGMNMAWNRSFLLDVVMPLLDGVTDGLERGARAIDVGCGGAVTLDALARKYPASVFHGVDQSAHGIAIAQERTADLDNVEVWTGGGEDLPTDPPYDFIMTLDIIHDLAFPTRVIGAIRNALADNGVWLVKDMRSAETFEGNQRNPLLPMMYGFSLTSCLASATSQPGGAALGTLGLTPSRLESMATEAGFSSFLVHKTDDPTHLYYEIRP